MDETLERLLSEAEVSAELLYGIYQFAGEIASRVGKATKTGGTGGGGGSAGSAAKSVGAIAQVTKFGTAVSAAIGSVLAFVAFPPMMTKAVMPFVAALNPGLIAAFNAQLDNLHATIGFALEPVIAQAAVTLRTFAGLLLPIVRQLRPIVADIAAAVSELLIGVVKAAVPLIKLVLTLIAPVVKQLTSLADLVGQGAEVLASLVDVVVELWQSLGGFGVTTETLASAFKLLRDMASKAAQGLAFVGAAALKLFGMSETLAKFRQNLEKRIAERGTPGGGLVAAPKDVTTSGIEDIMRKASERAFAAQSGVVAAKSDNDLLADILGVVKDVESTDLKTVLKEAFRDALKELRSEGEKAVQRRVDDVSSAVGVKGTTAAFVDLPADFATNILGVDLKRP